MPPILPLVQRIVARLTDYLIPHHYTVPPKDPHKLGRWGEEYAVRLLRREGLRVVARNWRDGKREIDVVMIDRRGGEVIFVEVKTRTNVTGTVGDIEGYPLEDAQIERLIGAINTFLQRHSLMLKRQGVRRYRLELVRLVVEEPSISGQRLTTHHPESSNELRTHVSRSVLRQKSLRGVFRD